MTNWTSLIEEVHQVLLRREALPSELSYWRHHFEAGGSIESMRKEMVNSHEFEFELRRQFKRPSSSQAEPEFVDALRRMALLGKPPFALRCDVVAPEPLPLELYSVFRFKAA